MVESNPRKAVDTLLHKETSLYTINRIVASCHHIQALVERIEKLLQQCKGWKLLYVNRDSYWWRLNMTSRHAVISKVLWQIAFSNAVMQDPLHGFQLQNYSVERQEVVYSIE